MLNHLLSSMIVLCPGCSWHIFLYSRVGFLLTYAPNPVTPIDLPHPDSNGDFNHGNTHPTKMIPEREKIGKNSHQLQDRGRNFKDGATKGQKKEPEEPAPMLQDANN